MSRNVVDPNDSSLLSIITFVTALGDYLTYFAVIKVLYELHGNALQAAFGGLGVGSAAAICSGLSIPFLKQKFNTKTLIISSQAFSFLVVALLLVAVLTESRSVALFFTLIFFQTLFSKIFEAARETHTHGLNNDLGKNRGIQSSLLGGLYKAQFIGPLLAYFLLSIFNSVVPVVMDLISFLICVFLSFSLTKGIAFSSEKSVFGAFRFLRANDNLLKLFLLRTFGFWIPASFFNMLIYQNAAERMGIGVEYAGVVYSVLGFGALLGSLWLSSDHGWVVKVKDSYLASGATVGFCIAYALMLLETGPVWNTFCYFLYGVCMGVNAISTQSLRRFLTKPEQLPSLMGLELLFSFGIQFCLSWFIGAFLVSASNPFNIGFCIATFFSLIVATVYRISSFD
jgi:hypothetical protein